MRTALRALLGAVAFPLLAAGCAQSRYRVDSNVVYTPPGWPVALAADIYVPDGRAPRPAVLVVHGGGWERRARDDMDGIAGRLAARGFVVMNVAYRFAPAHRFPAQLHDLQQAVRWMRSVGAGYGIDPRRIGAFGYSSGGHLAALLGTVSNGDPLDRPHGGAQTRLQAVVAGGMPSDLRKFAGGRLVPQFLGATRAENPALFAAASPILHVSSDDPPMFLYHGGGDRLVDVSHAEDMKRALDEAGVRTELRVVPLLGHVLTFLLARGTENEAMDFLQVVLTP
jgi:acetyl esterase/lipase